MYAVRSEQVRAIVQYMTYTVDIEEQALELGEIFRLDEVETRVLVERRTSGVDISSESIWNTTLISCAPSHLSVDTYPWRCR